MRNLKPHFRRIHILVLAALLAAARPWPAAAQDQPAAAAVDGAPQSRQDRLLAGWTIVAGSYLATAGYGYYTWYQDGNRRDFYTKSDGWFGADTYAGGADKLGHCFSNYVLTRAGFDVLSWAGLTRNNALAASIALDALLYASIEIKDGQTVNLGFSWGDLVADVCGNLLAAAFVLNPALDRSLDFRLEYYPSPEYVDSVEETGTLNAVEDYTGMTFGLWYHLGAVPGLKKVPALSWLRFFDIGVTYGTRYYRPHPDDDREPRRELSAALTLDVAAIVRALAAGRTPHVVGASNWIFEYFTIPGTTLEVR